MISILAIEQENAQIVNDNLQKIYPGWQFIICPTVKHLESWINRRPDVVVVSRFLPGMEPAQLLRYLPAMFSASHIVLLTGENTESARAYIRIAKQNGLNNIVTGPLPGDRPYTLITALKHNRDWTANHDEYEDNPRPGDKEPVSYTEEQTISQDLKPQVDSAALLKELPLKQQIVFNEPDPGTKQQLERPTPIVHQVPTQSEAFGTVFASGTVTPEHKWSTRRGILVVTTANKGGVGKTTTAVTVATALANAGVEVVIADLDFASPNVKTHFKISPENGIESLAGRSLFLDHVLTSSPKNNNIKILPGPLDKTIPPEAIFRSGQLAEIINMLLDTAPVVIADTPANFWDRPWLPEVYGMADLILAVVDQSEFSKEDTREYAPKLILMGVTPEKIRIVLNKYSPKLHNARIIEKAFNEGFKSSVAAKMLPRVIATIPEEWDAHCLNSYKGETVGLNDARSQWHLIAQEVAQLAGQHYTKPAASKKKSMFGFLKRG